MIIGLLTVKLHIPGSGSLKEKRMVIKGLKDRLRSRFNISVSEVDNHDKWQLADIAMANISTDKTRANSVLSMALNLIEECKDIYITDHHLEFF